MYEIIQLRGSLREPATRLGMDADFAAGAVELLAAQYRSHVLSEVERLPLDLTGMGKMQRKLGFENEVRQYLLLIEFRDITQSILQREGIEDFFQDVPVWAWIYYWYVFGLASLSICYSSMQASWWNQQTSVHSATKAYVT